MIRVIGQTRDDTGRVAQTEEVLSGCWQSAQRALTRLAWRHDDAVAIDPRSIRGVVRYRHGKILTMEG